MSRRPRDPVTGRYLKREVMAKPADRRVSNLPPQPARFSETPIYDELTAACTGARACPARYHVAGCFSWAPAP